MSSRELLLGTALALGLLLPQPSKSDVIASLGVNPVSGDFTRTGIIPLGGSFEDQYTFSISAGPIPVATAFARNIFDVPAEFINDFTGAIWSTGVDGIVNNTDDQLVLGIQTATQCPSGDCQVLNGSQSIGPGNYYLEISGKGSANAEYTLFQVVSQLPYPDLLLEREFLDS